MKISLDERQKLMLLAALTVLALLLVAVYRHHEKRQSAPDVYSCYSPPNSDL